MSEPTKFRKSQNPKKREPHSVVQRSIALNVLDSAISLLKNNRIDVDEKQFSLIPDPKFAHDSASLEVRSKVQFDSSALALARSMLGNSVYKFRCSRAASITSGSSTISVNLSNDLSSMSEGTCLIALFDECRLLKSRIHLASAVYQSNTIGAVFGVFGALVGFYPSVDTVTPTASAVARLPGCLLFPSNASIPIGITSPTLRSRNWGFTVDEGVSAPRIVSGMNSQWKITAAGGTPTSSTQYFGYITMNLVEFRSRT